MVFGTSKPLLALGQETDKTPYQSVMASLTYGLPPMKNPVTDKASKTHKREIWYLSSVHPLLRPAKVVNS